MDHVSETPLRLVSPSVATFAQMSFASQLKDVEDKIEAMERQLLLLKQRRNSLVPVCRLPPELLARVFSIVQREDDPTDDPTDDPDFAFDRRVRGWPRVTRVCTHFRVVAIQTPMLWNVHDFNRPVSTWRQLCLARAAGTPSCIRIIDGRGAEHLCRAWKAIVEIINNRNTNHEVFDAITAPHLRVLSVNQPLYDHRSSEFEITSSFLGGSLPLTTHFMLEGISILLSKAPRMPLLRRLVLHDIQTPVNLEAMLELFEHSSMLEEISLRFISLDNNRQALMDESAVTSVPKRVSLPHLKSLSFEDSPKKVAAFVRLLPIPSKALTIEVMDEGLADLDPNHATICEAYLSFIASHPHSQELGIGSILLRDDDLDTIEFGQNIAQNLHHPLDVVGFFSCDWLSGRHRLFDHISVLRVSRLPTASHNDAPWGSYLLPKLDTLILESLEDYDMENEGYIKSWLVQQEGRIKRVQFNDCSLCFVRVLEELEREQVVSQVIWNC
jgi:hypothetical protein